MYLSTNGMIRDQLSSLAINKINKWEETSRKERITENWDIIFLKQAFEWAKKSHDAQTQCGAVLVTKNHRIISTGYNGFIRNVEDNVLPNLRPDKYDWMIHAEHNAILDCAFQGKSARWSTMYVTGEPCLNCYQFMYQAGVDEIIYSDNNAVMTKTDVEYKTNVEIFLWLTRKTLKTRHIPYAKIFPDLVDKTT